jgi:mannose-1-phosphate guanylyltransferase
MAPAENAGICGTEHVWVLVLAGGEGSRLRSLTRAKRKVAAPKQFWSLSGGASLLQETLDRAEAIAPRHQICMILSAHHRQWWEKLLQELPELKPVIQPENRGTGIGILLPLLHILYRDPQARIVVLPCDHYVQDEKILALSIHQGLACVHPRSEDVLLLGIEPEMPDPELGYIVPGRFRDDQTASVEHFVEKPTVLHAQELIARGALWNAFIVAATAQGLLRLFERRHLRAVRIVRELVESDRRGALDPLFAIASFGRLPDLDFSHDVVAGQESCLRVKRVPRCGWSDLGTPRRVAETLRRLERTDHPRAMTESFAACFDRAQ